MDADTLLGRLRCGVLVVDRFGTITQAEGGLGGIFGRPASALVDRNVLEFIDTAQHASIAEIFVSGEEALPILTFPTSFSVNVIDADGSRSVADIVPTGFTDGDDEGWVVTVTARDVQPAPYGVLDAVLSGGSIEAILTEVARRFDVDNGDNHRTQAFGLYAAGAGDPVDVFHARIDCPIAEALKDSVAGFGLGEWLGWRGSQLKEAPVEALPPLIAEAAAEAGYTAVQVGVVDLDGRCSAAVLWFVTSRARAEVRANASLVGSSIMRVVELAVRRDHADGILRHTALHDSLTGLPNRSGLDRAVSGLPSEQAVAAVFVDVDDFKEVNDTFGHAIGDLVLAEVAQRIQSACRPDDVVSRVGGDEFAVLVHGVDAPTARAVAERILANVSAHLEIEGGPPDVSVTVGLSAPGDGWAVADLMDEADRAMLEGKRSGRRGSLVVAG